MQILRDTERIRVQRRQARLLTALGVILLVGALILSNTLAGLNQEYMIVWLVLSYIALIAGFIFFNTGLQGIAKWSRRPRGDERIDNHLKRLNDRFTVFHYAKLNGKVHDHTVLHPGGVTVLITRDNFGQISYTNGRWSKGAVLWKRLLNWAGPPVGNPHAEAAAATQALQDYLHGEGQTVEVDSVIVFVNPLVQLSVNESAIPICRVEDLASVLMERSQAATFSPSQRLEVTELLTKGIQQPEGATDTPKAAGGVRQRGSRRYQPATRVSPATAAPKEKGRTRR